MCKIRLPLFILGLMLVLSTVSEARVCFLGSGKCIVGNTNYDVSNCVGYTECEVPKQNATSCQEKGLSLYSPQECCTNEDYWEYCSAAEGKICQGTVCTGKSESNIEYSTCEKGQCVCHPDFNKDCAAEGKIGYGLSCGGLYKECRCDTSKYFKCGANASSQGTVCTDSTGTYYSQCVCPSLSTDYWEDRSSDCCYYSGSSCQNKPSNTTYYKCRTWSVPSCTCGYTHMSGKPNCLNGCTDSSYDYKGNSEHVVCDSGSVTNLAQTGICGNDCHCATGYWDYKDTCSSLSNSACADLGYKETSCEGDFLACPFDASAKVCIEATSQCEYADQSDCETQNANSVCSQNSLGCFETSGCKAGYYPSIYQNECLSLEQHCDEEGYDDLSDGTCPIDITDSYGNNITCHLLGNYDTCEYNCLEASAFCYSPLYSLKPCGEYSDEVYDNCIFDYESMCDARENDCVKDCERLKCETDDSNCDGYTLTSCPSDAICEFCTNGDTVKYKIYWQVDETGCAIGDVFYSDGSCSSIEKYDSSKTAVGVVYALSDTKGGLPWMETTDKSRSEHGRVINLKNLTYDFGDIVFNPENPYNNTDESFYFGLYQTDVSGVTNYDTDEKMLTALKNGNLDVFRGKENTDKFAKSTTQMDDCINGGYDDYPEGYNTYCTPLAAKAAVSFYPPNVNKTHSIVGAGNWYLPAIGELALLHGSDMDTLTLTDGLYITTGTTLTIVNATLTALAEKNVATSILGDIWYWSSNEYEGYSSWEFYDGYLVARNRDWTARIRLSLEF
ncbi:MAG: hypothetical protein E7016_03295 [Alphaproteobacteria bacterium]|nr:hypothetical protein [Alphaproteobacteria bacterium]